MIRTPLRPLARVLKARQTGENPDAIERENIRLRHEEMRDKARLRAQGRLLVLSVFFLGAFMTVGARMGHLAASEPMEPQARASGSQILAQRAAHLPDQCKTQIRVQGPFVKFVKDHRADAFKRGIALDHAGQDAFGHHLDPCCF